MQRISSTSPHKIQPHQKDTLNHKQKLLAKRAAAKVVRRKINESQQLSKSNINTTNLNQTQTEQGSRIISPIHFNNNNQASPNGGGAFHTGSYIEQQKKQYSQTLVPNTNVGPSSSITLQNSAQRSSHLINSHQNSNGGSTLGGVLTFKSNNQQQHQIDTQETHNSKKSNTTKLQTFDSQFEEEKLREPAKNSNQPLKPLYSYENSISNRESKFSTDQPPVIQSQSRHKPTQSYIPPIAMSSTSSTSKLTEGEKMLSKRHKMRLTSGDSKRQSNHNLTRSLIDEGSEDFTNIEERLQEDTKISCRNAVASSLNNVSQILKQAKRQSNNFKNRRGTTQSNISRPSNQPSKEDTFETSSFFDEGVSQKLVIQQVNGQNNNNQGSIISPHKCNQVEGYNLPTIFNTLMFGIDQSKVSDNVRESFSNLSSKGRPSSQHKLNNNVSGANNQSQNNGTNGSQAFQKKMSTKFAQNQLEQQRQSIEKQQNQQQNQQQQQQVQLRADQQKPPQNVKSVSNNNGAGGLSSLVTKVEKSNIIVFDQSQNNHQQQQQNQSQQYKLNLNPQGTSKQQQQQQNSNNNQQQQIQRQSQNQAQASRNQQERTKNQQQNSSQRSKQQHNKNPSPAHSPLGRQSQLSMAAQQNLKIEQQIEPVESINSENNNQNDHLNQYQYNDQEGDDQDEDEEDEEQVQSAAANHVEDFQSSELHRNHLIQTLQSLQYIKTLPPVNKNDIKTRTVKLPAFKNNNIKKTIIFDLDETLVHCIDDIENNPCDQIINVTFPNGDTVQAGINIRPYAIECLKKANENYQVVVFTASHKAYADVVLDNLDPTHSLIQYRLYRDHCIRTEEGIYIKDLRIISNRQLKDLIIVDNAVYSFGYQLDNGIPIIPFYDDKSDEELMHLIFYFNCLAQCQDVREQNRKAFQLKDLQEIDIAEYLQSMMSQGSASKNNRNNHQEDDEDDDDQ